MGADGDGEFTGHKPHRKPNKGRKFDKKDSKTKRPEGLVDPKIRNPKAFAINSAVRAERKFRRAQDHETKKDRVPLVDRSPVEDPPFVVAIVGPPKVGKSTLFTNLIKNYTRQTLSDIKGPVTIITGKKRRLTIIECNNDIHSMIDVAKVADLALLLVDASFGFEMEVFEFLNICQVHGFPQIMGVLTHLDQFRNKKKLKKTKKTLKHRFWTEVYPGAKLFYLSGYFPMTNTYPKNEVHNLARFISVMKFRPTVWRTEHSYVVADRMEDLTSLEETRVNPKVDRRISLYGWVHGTFLKQHVSVHIPGLGDFTPDAINALPDPCPLPMKERTLRRNLNEKEKIMYAPFSGVGGIVYDQDAVYIDLGGSHSHRKRLNVDTDNNVQGPITWMDELRELKSTLDQKMDSAGLKLFSNSEAITGADVVEEEEIVNDSEEMNVEENDDTADTDFAKRFTSVVANDGRIRRRVLFDTENDEDDVTKSIFNEIQDIKKTNSFQNLETQLDSDVEEDESENENGSEEESEDDEEMDVLDTQSKNKSTPNTNINSEANESINFLVSKLKSKLKSKDIDTANTSVDTESVEFEEEDSDSDDDDAIVESDQEMDEENENKSDDNSEHSESESEGEPEQNYQAKKTPNPEAREKEQRFSLAEEGFYSRFKNRSIQRMIYDDAEDYLSVTAKADFDLANCQLAEQSNGNTEEEMKELFIGGDYADTAKELLDVDNENEEDVFGDFEELDDDNDDDEQEENANKKSKLQMADGEKEGKNREEMKKKLKEKFDMDYDDGEGGDKSFYRDWKAQTEEQSKINRTFFKDVEDASLLKDLQGLQPGTYVRIEISRIPCEFVVNFEPQRCCPLIVGSLDSPNQETLAVVQARVKKHRWHPKILKTRDPIVLSVGWRRFQTISLYSVQDHNMRNRMIKYTPDHLHCIANFYGPMTPQGTGILGIAPSDFDGFRITLTGTVLDMDKSSELVKKLKLVGSPAKIFKKSAFIEGMFSSQLEVAKFVGAKIKTVSGIRGVIKKELRTPVGAFRATFEDKIVQSDIVFCRTWARAEVPKFFLNLPTLITAQPRVMKTVGQLKRERQIQVEPNQDNLYTPIERQAKRFRPLKIPKSLQQKLPYNEKPKVLAKLNEPKRIAVIKDPHERQMTKFLKTLKTRMTEKEAKEKLEKAKVSAQREKMLKKVEENQTRRQKELRKKVFRTLGQINKSETNSSGGSGARGRGGGSSRGRGGSRGGGRGGSRGGREGGRGGKQKR